MTDEIPNPKRCHKNLDHDCMQEDCPMWFIPPNPNSKGDCAEALVMKDIFWQRVREMANNMRREAANMPPEQAEEEPTS